MTILFFHLLFLGDSALQLVFQVHNLKIETSSTVNSTFMHNHQVCVMIVIIRCMHLRQSFAHTQLFFSCLFVNITPPSAVLILLFFATSPNQKGICSNQFNMHFSILLFFNFHHFMQVKETRKKSTSLAANVNAAALLYCLRHMHMCNSQVHAPNKDSIKMHKASE